MLWTYCRTRSRHGWAFGTSVAPDFRRLLHNGHAPDSWSWTRAAIR